MIKVKDHIYIFFSYVFKTVVYITVYGQVYVSQVTNTFNFLFLISDTLNRFYPIKNTHILINGFAEILNQISHSIWLRINNYKYKVSQKGVYFYSPKKNPFNLLDLKKTISTTKFYEIRWTILWNKLKSKKIVNIFKKLFIYDLIRSKKFQLLSCLPGIYTHKIIYFHHKIE